MRRVLTTDTLTITKRTVEERTAWLAASVTRAGLLLLVLRQVPGAALLHDLHVRIRRRAQQPGPGGDGTRANASCLS